MTTRYVGVRGAAKYAGVGRDTFLAWVEQGRVPEIRTGKAKQCARRFDLADIDMFMSRCKKTRSPSRSKK